MQDVKLYTQNAPQYEGDCEYRISSIVLMLIYCLFLVDLRQVLWHRRVTDQALL